MPRTKKYETTEETEVDEVVNENVTETTEETEVPVNVEKLMKLYPHYESFYVTSTGFVHPMEAPKYLLKDAVLYKNKYFKS